MVIRWLKVEGQRLKVEGQRSKVEGQRSKVEGQRSKVEGGQALVEMAIGMFAIVLVISAMVAFSAYMVRSLGVQGEARRKAGVAALSSMAPDGAFATANESDTVEFDGVASEYVFGQDVITIREKCSLPAMKGM